MTERIISIDRLENLINVFGAFDENLHLLEKELQVSIIDRDSELHISGDEFLAYGVIDHADEALGLVTVVKDELERMNREDPWICNITAGVGVYAAVPREEDNLDIFMTRSDQAMYEDKNKRKYGRRKDDIV